EDDDGNLFEYIGYRDFNDEDYKFETWYDEITKRNWYTNDIKCTADDKYITLSTCSKLIEENLRWVIVAKKLTPEDDIDHIVESYQDKDDKDIYFPAFWRERYGNNKVDQGWQL
ncbi:MAG: class B sortase, partial [Ruminococcus sp.]|nr:class B sortase [Ruminococcus sp.]